MATNLLRLIDLYGIEKSMINLEIPETAAVNAPKVLLKNMNTLHNEGISFSLDDFGTGYSNINAIMSMPLNIIKFDRSLILTAKEYEHGIGVIDSSVAMVKKMGLKIVAEGIEELEQVDMLYNMGVDYIQGYYYSKPLPEKEFIDYLKKAGNNKA